MILLCWRQKMSSLASEKLITSSSLLQSLLCVEGIENSIVQVKRRFNTQLGKINFNGFVTESHFIGFCLKNRKKKSHIWAFFFWLVAAPQCQIKVYKCIEGKKIK